MASNNQSELTRLGKRRAFLINLAYTAVWIVIAVLAVGYLLKWMMPFVAAFIVAAVLQKPLKFLVRISRGNRKFFSVILVVLMVLLLAGAVALIGWRLIVWLMGFVNGDTIKTVQSAITGAGDAIRDFLQGLGGNLPQSAADSLSNGIDSLSQQLVTLVTTALKNVAAGAVELTTHLPMVLLSFIMWIVASVLLTIDYHQVTGFFLRQVPDRHAELVMHTRELCHNTLFKLLKAYLLLMLITFAELSLGLSVLQVKSAIPLAALIAVVDILPVLGTGTVLIPWALISLLYADFPRAIGLAVLYVVITVIRNVIEPRLVSYQIGLNPLVTLFFMYLGLRALGLPGMILFPVIVIILVQLQDSGYIHLWK
ncbi:MAG: sporulation integral membrane protein YtvI [Acutalibacteraceae bacterium]|jgi:sporulation integral membrane protein YtvI